MPKWSQNHLKINTLAFRGLIFTIFGRLLRHPKNSKISKALWTLKKAQRSTDVAHRAAKGAPRDGKAEKRAPPLGARADPPEPSQAQLS